MLTRLGGEDDGANTLDLHAGGIPKLEGASDARVKLGEELPSAHHVMGGAGVEDPPINLVIAGAVAEGGTRPRLVEVEVAVADVDGGSSMLACATSRAASACAT